MKLIESSAEYIPQEPGLDGIYKQIEKCGRVCYKSEGNITEDSAKPFVDKLIASNHLAMLEHGTVYLSAIPWRAKIDYNISPWIKKHSNPKYDTYQQNCCITCNYRMLVENNYLDDLQYLCSPTEYHEKRYTMKFVTSIGIARELIRHRVFSFANESTRFCNYSKDKFDNGITFIVPSWTDLKMLGKEEKTISSADAVFCYNCQIAEGAYLELIKTMSPQQARELLPLCTKSELVMTGFASDWRNVFDQRLFGKTGIPHPDMVALMEKAKTEFERPGVWEDIMSYPSKYN